MAELISVSPKQRGDEHHRYMMPKMGCKWEGGGCVSRTVLVNIAQISKRLNRSPELITAYLGTVNGTSFDVKKLEGGDTKYSISAQVAHDSLRDNLDDFILKYVLCLGCGNPETSLETAAATGKKKKKAESTVTITCRACGHSGQLPKSTPAKIMKLLVRYAGIQDDGDQLNEDDAFGIGMDDGGGISQIPPEAALASALKKENQSEIDLLGAIQDIQHDYGLSKSKEIIPVFVSAINVARINPEKVFFIDIVKALHSSKAESALIKSLLSASKSSSAKSFPKSQMPTLFKSLFEKKLLSQASLEKAAKRMEKNHPGLKEAVFEMF
eukprot:TRINITY_DN787_c0_g3_i3.p1 TRINITY_DN787_c0_g3~~TRINITY_DN787_c0_g3_i3.p1  ORF type:complete len:326 (+),score=74.53 TRINITY_DN787_c0_g3_i3:116-1093(+)